MAEVKAIQKSLAFVASAPELEPSGDLTAQILLTGKQARAEMKKGATPLRTALKVVQAGSCAAGIVLVAGLTFVAFLDSGEPEVAAPAFKESAPAIAASQVASPDASPEDLRKAALDVAADGQALTAAIQSKHGATLSPEELEELRVVQAREDDIAVAVSALERNPRNVRATHVVHATMDSLRDMYVEGGSGGSL